LLLGATSGKLLLQLLVPFAARNAAQDVLDLSLDIVKQSRNLLSCYAADRSETGLEVVGCSSSSSYFRTMPGCAWTFSCQLNLGGSLHQQCIATKAKGV
jgi:hypothetical protein